ncbi:hypothetical protein, variant [Fonticula alba]|uniref:Uncharacterized protein n=1 Tax=Fonticula alba TaxID=691883 RepID=A0A058Z698_FONAL|nr:hypothetical protein, variant [Fonticula alba]KCV69027.1 hypothetical protein, variant [Fonticula alba]|eukprot:XP_009496598.1 hypothetical protein, variant [Fonticula alba]
MVPLDVAHLLRPALPDPGSAPQTGAQPFVYVTGPPAAGKSAVVRATLEALGRPFAWVTGGEATASSTGAMSAMGAASTSALATTLPAGFRSMLENLLDQLAGCQTASKATSGDWASVLAASLDVPSRRVGSPSDFVSQVRELVWELGQAAGPAPAPPGAQAPEAEWARWDVAVARHARRAAVVLVIDEADRLRGLPPYALAMLSGLAELTGVAVTTVMISRLPVEVVRPRGPFLEPYLMHFPQYSEDDTIRILVHNYRASAPAAMPVLPSGEALTRSADAGMHEAFCRLLYQVFHGACRDLRDLTHVAESLYGAYRGPVVAGLAAPGDSYKLYRHISPYFQVVLDRLYLRTISSREWIRIRRDSHRRAVGADAPGAECGPGPGKRARHVGPPGSQVIPGDLFVPGTLPGGVANELELQAALNAAAAAGIGTASRSGLDFELPMHGKFLLVSAFLASHNPARADSQMFARAGSAEGGRRRRAGGGGAFGNSPLKAAAIRGAAATVPQRLLGPRPFRLERLIAIFRMLLQSSGDELLLSGAEREVLASADLAQLIRTLTSLRLLVRGSLAGAVAGLDASGQAAGASERRIPLEGATYRCAVGYDAVAPLARSLGIHLESVLFRYN